MVSKLKLLAARLMWVPYGVLLFSLTLLMPSTVHAQQAVVGASCPASGQNAIATSGQPVVCTGSPLVWTTVGGGGISSVSLPACASSTNFTFASTFITDFFLNLNCNVTSSTLSGSFVTGTEGVFTITQASGGNTFTWPANFLNTPTINAAPGGSTVATFQYCGAIGNGSACPANSWQNTDVGPAGGAGSFATYIDPVAQFGLIQDAKWVTDAVYNSTQTTCGSGSGLPAGTCITLSATDPPFSCPGAVFPCTSGGDVGKQEFGTKNCPGGNPGGCNKAVPKGTIVEVWDATHAQVSVAANGNSVGTMNNFGWGSAGNSAKLQTMANFLANNPGTAVQFPCAPATTGTGTTGGVGAFWLDANNSTAFAGIPARSTPIGIFGCRTGTGTLFISCPDPGPTSIFNNGTSYLVGNAPYPGTFGSYDQFSDLIFWGLGNDTGTNEGHALVTINGPAKVENVWVLGYAWNVTTAFVINGILCNGCTMVNSGAYAGGNYPVQLSGSANQFFQTSMLNGIAGGSNSPGLTINGTTSVDGGGMIKVDSSYVYGNTLSIYGVVNTSTVPVTMTGNYIGSLQQTGTGTLNLIGNNIDRFNSNAPFALNVTNGIVNLEGNSFIPQGLAFLSQSGGTVRDLGGNTGMNAPTLTGGLYTGSASANNTLVTAAKTVLSAGWGTTAAVTALSGGDAPIQFTITNSGTGQAASPTITYTFPNPYQVAPFRCTATQTGGTNATGTFTSSALSTTGVTFTFSLTPTASSTEIVLVTCDVQ